MTTPTSKYDSGRTPEPLNQRIRRMSIESNGCWLWQGRIGRWGYGEMKIGSRRDGTRRQAKAHIVAYETFVGPVPTGMTLDHSCNVRCCVNPAHLTPMTMRDNTLKPGSRAVTAVNAAKTHCAKGHPLSGENLRIRPDNGGRVCRTCQGWTAMQ